MAELKIGEAYANIVDHGASVVPQGFDNTAAIQAAIDTGRHVLVPKGEFYVLSRVYFRNDGQRCSFLSQAFLRVQGPDGGIWITGKNQEFYGMYVIGDFTTPADPCVSVLGADHLLMDNLTVECSPVATLLRVRNTYGMVIAGGHINGVNELNTNTGLDLG